MLGPLASKGKWLRQEHRTPEQSTWDFPPPVPAVPATLLCHLDSKPGLVVHTSFSSTERLRQENCQV